MKHKILIACEFSGRIREAFIKKGFPNTYSCDLLNTDIPSKNHITGDVIKILKNNWDMVISHPPCQYLSYAGANNWKNLKNGEQQKALDFFFEFINCNAEFICVENPKGLACRYIKPSQWVSPHEFGDIYSKKTALWLKNIPPLIKTTPQAKPLKVFDNYYVKGKSNGHKRSITSQFLAEAMAEQWGNFLKGKKTQLQLF